MKKSLLEIYALLVCLITVVWAVIAIGTATYDFVRISFPEVTISSWEYEKYLSNAGYREKTCSDKDSKPISDEEVEKRRIEGKTIAIQEERRSAFQSLIKNAIALVINILVFLGHWILAKRARTTA